MTKSIVSFWRNRAKPILDLVRFGHAIMFGISLIIGVYLFNPEFSDISSLVLPLLVVMFSEIGSFALNDALDADSDKENLRTDRPIVRGEITEQFAFRLGWVFVILSTLLALPLGTAPFIFVLAINVLAILYDYYLKDILLIGNMYIAFCMSAPFLFAYILLYGRLGPDPTLLFISATAFLFGLAREIAKDVMDMEGDAKIRSSKTLPILVGPKKAMLFVFYIFFIAGIYSMIFSIQFSSSLHMEMVLAFSIATFIVGFFSIYKTSIAHTNQNIYKVVAREVRSKSLVVLMLGIIILMYIAMYGG